MRARAGAPVHLPLPHRSAPVRLHPGAFLRCPRLSFPASQLAIAPPTLSHSSPHHPTPPPAGAQAVAAARAVAGGGGHPLPAHSALTQGAAAGCWRRQRAWGLAVQSLAGAARRAARACVACPRPGALTARKRSPVCSPPCPQPLPHAPAPAPGPTPQDEFYNRYLVKNRLLEPVVAIFLGEGSGLLEGAQLQALAKGPLRHVSSLAGGPRARHAPPHASRGAYSRAVAPRAARQPGQTRHCRAGQGRTGGPCLRCQRAAAGGGGSAGCLTAPGRCRGLVLRTLRQCPALLSGCRRERAAL